MTMVEARGGARETAGTRTRAATSWRRLQPLLLPRKKSRRTAAAAARRPPPPQPNRRRRRPYAWRDSPKAPGAPPPARSWTPSPPPRWPTHAGGGGEEGGAGGTSDVDPVEGAAREAAAALELEALRSTLKFRPRQAGEGVRLTEEDAGGDGRRRGTVGRGDRRAVAKSRILFREGQRAPLPEGRVIKKYNNQPGGDHEGGR